MTYNSKYESCELKRERRDNDSHCLTMDKYSDFLVSIIWATYPKEGHGGRWRLSYQSEHVRKKVERRKYFWPEILKAICYIYLSCLESIVSFF